MMQDRRPALSSPAPICHWKFLMKLLITALMLTAGLATAQAQDTGKKSNAQSNRMVACQKEAGEKQLSGAERQAYVNECLRNKPARPSQGEKLGACSKEAAAKGLKGEERNRYLSECARRG
jgi:hypothetical protein